MNRKLTKRRRVWAHSSTHRVPVLFSRRGSARRGRVMLDPTRYAMGGAL